MIHAGEVTPGRRGKAVERTKADENAVQVKQGRRAGTGTVRGREQRKGEEEKQQWDHAAQRGRDASEQRRA